MIKKLLLMILPVVSFKSAIGQGQYTFTASTIVANTIPFATSYSATSNNERQLIYYPSNFPTAPSGFITTIYLHLTAAVSPNITNMFVRMGPTTQSIFTTTGGGNTWITGLTSVYSGPFTATTGTGNWLAIPLQTPFYYDNTQNFVLDMGHMGYTTGFQIYQGNGGFVGRGMFGSSNNATGSVQDRLTELGFDISPLPLKLISFDAASKNGTTTLNWTVAEETNMDKYIVERSADSKSFNEVGTVHTLASSADQKHYSFTDNSEAISGTAYYRLKMMEVSGIYNYSHVVRVQSSGSVSFSAEVFPNPFKDEIRLMVTASDAARLTYDLRDVSGKSVVSGSENLLPGSNTVTIPSLQVVASGTYSLLVRAGTREETIKLTK